MSSNAIIDFNSRELTFEAFEGIFKLDKTFVGTSNYLGLAYFWAYEYRHYLRDCTMAKRRKVHKKFMQADLELHGESEKHLDIIETVLDGVTLASGFTVKKRERKEKINI